MKGYQGIFFDEPTKEKLIDLQENPLEEVVKDMHITFLFGKTEKYTTQLMEKETPLEIIGYASDGKNSGFEVKLPEYLEKYYKNSTPPHITVSIGEVDGVKGKPVDTGKLDFKPLEDPITISGKLGYFIYGKGKVLDNSAFEERKEEKKVNIIDTQELANKLEMKPIQRTLGNGRVVEQIVWDKENLQKAVKEVKGLSAKGEEVKITGPAPAWMVSALTHTVHPSPVSVYVPQIDKYVPVGSLKHGERNPEGEVSFEVKEKGNAVLVEYSMDCDVYDENNLSKVVVPELSKGKHVYISGRGPNYLTTSIAESYAHTNGSVSLFQPGTGYTCAITHSREKELGDVVKDPFVMEEVKENLTEEVKKGPSLDD